MAAKKKPKIDLEIDPKLPHAAEAARVRDQLKAKGWDPTLILAVITAILDGVPTVVAILQQLADVIHPKPTPAPAS